MGYKLLKTGKGVPVKFTTDHTGKWCLTYNKGNPFLDGSVDWESISAVKLTGFLRWLFIKGKLADVVCLSERLGQLMAQYSVRPLWVLNKEQTEVVRFICSSDDTFSIWYKQYRDYLKGGF